MSWLYHLYSITPCNPLRIVSLRIHQYWDYVANSMLQTRHNQTTFARYRGNIISQLFTGLRHRDGVPHFFASVVDPPAYPAWTLTMTAAVVLPCSRSALPVVSCNLR